MIPWFQVYSNLPQHPKTAKLADELKLSSPVVAPNIIATGILIAVWAWAIQNAPDGDLSTASMSAIADACRWKKKPETLVNAMLSAGYLDSDMRLHDWEEYALLIMTQEEERKRKTRERVARYRQSKRDAADPVTDTQCNAECNVTDTPSNAPTLHNITEHNITEHNSTERIERNDLPFFLSDDEAVYDPESLGDLYADSIYSGLSSEERRDKALTFAKLAKKYFDDQMQPTAQNFARTAAAGGVRLSKRTYEVLE